MTRSDALVIITMIILISFMYAFYWSFGGEQNSTNYAQISITDAQPQKVSLHQDKIIKLMGRSGVATIQIKNKKIRFLNSPCAKKYCIHSGWLKNIGSIASCIPNGITLSIKNSKNLFDAINF